MFSLYRIRTTRRIKQSHKFSLFDVLMKRDVFGIKGYDLQLTIEYMFTELIDDVSHEPFGLIPAARFYPMLKFDFFNESIDEVDPLESIRVDYHCNFHVFDSPYQDPIQYKEQGNQGGKSWKKVCEKCEKI